MLTWGWIVGSTFTIMIACSLAEITSTYPVSGSTYHWAGILSKREYAGLSSFVCGWFSFLGNTACDASYAYGFAQIVAAIVTMATEGSVEVNNQHRVAIAIGCMFSFAIKNIAKMDAQGWFNNASAIFQMVTTLGIIIAIIVAAPQRSTSEFVWTEFYNTTGLDNKIYVCIIGLLTTLYGMSGYEAASQVSEETQNAQVSAPQGIVKGVIAAIVTGLAFFIGLLYSMNANYEAVLNNGITEQPVINIFYLAFNGGKVGPLIISILLAINVYLGGFSHMTVTTRIVFAMSRDGAFPGSKYIAGVSGKSQLPLKSIFFVFVIDSIIVLLPLISDTAFSAITQISTIGYSISYAIPIILRVTVSRKTFQQGPWNIGRLSIINGIIASIFLVLTSICFFFPTSFDENLKQTAEDFNYTIVVFTVALLIAATYWFLPKKLGGARHFFTGPVRPEDVLASETPKQFVEKKIVKGSGGELSDPSSHISHLSNVTNITQ